MCICICICVYIMLFRNWNNCADIYKLFYMIIDYPFTLCRNATIPIYDSTKWNKTIFTFFPLFTLIFFTIIFNCKYHYYIYTYITSPTLTHSISLFHIPHNNFLFMHNHLSFMFFVSPLHNLPKINPLLSTMYILTNLHNVLNMDMVHRK